MTNEEKNIEILAEKVHEAYLVTCARLGWTVNEINKVPYSELPEDSKDLDRETVKAVLDAVFPDIAEDPLAPTRPEIRYYRDDERDWQITICVEEAVAYMDYLEDLRNKYRSSK